MKIRRFYGKDMREALKQVKDELGGDAVIMSNKKHADGIEIVAAYDKEPDAELLPNKAQPKVQTSPIKKTPTLSRLPSNVTFLGPVAKVGIKMPQRVRIMPAPARCDKQRPG